MNHDDHDALSFHWGVHEHGTDQQIGDRYPVSLSGGLVMIRIDTPPGPPDTMTVVFWSDGVETRRGYFGPLPGGATYYAPPQAHCLTEDDISDQVLS